MFDEDETQEEYNPSKYQCPKCGTEMHWQVNTGWIESPITMRDNPICPKCWDEFLQTLGIEMKKVEE